jgi:glycosyltransferase involved in cell wall biosynthesis
MLNILSIVPYNFLPAKMGGQKGIAFFYRYFGKLVNVTCVTTKGNEVHCAENYQVLDILSKSQFRYANIFYFFTLKKIIKERQVSHLIIEHPYFGWLGILLQQFCGVKLVVHSHNIEALRFKSTGKWWWQILWQYERFVHRRANHNFFIHDDDKAYAIEKFKLDAGKCSTITYGFELNAPPSIEERSNARKKIGEQYGIDNSKSLLLFNGTLNYKPNLDALDVILHQINAVLQSSNFNYAIVICGKNLPASYNNLKAYKEKNIVFAGFVDDIDIFFKAADIFINPVIEGGGIKTKLVEALGYNMSVVTTKSGAIGVPQTITGKKMFVAADGAWDDFAKAITAADTAASIPASFFEHFYWGNIAAKATKALATTN